MNQKRLTLLIFLSAFSIVFLIILQLYWIRTTVETQQSQFDQVVMETMNMVVQKLEREEAITKVTSSLFNGDDFEKTLGDSSITINKSELIGATDRGEAFTELPTVIKTPADQLRIEFTPPKDDSSFFIIRKTQKRILSSTIDYQSTQGDSLIKKQLKKKATLINDLVNELALISISKNLNDRVSFRRIDSLFYHELHSQGIHTNYVFDILDVESGGLTFSEEEGEESELRQTPYRINLYQNDFFTKKYSI